MTWPHGLETLTFGDDYDQSLEKVIWPSARVFFSHPNTASLGQNGVGLRVPWSTATG